MISRITIPVPTTGEGALVNTSSLVGPKTVVFSGYFSGIYELLGSQDDVHFVPIVQFDSGGLEGVRQTISGSFSSMRLRAVGTTTPPSSSVTCVVSATTAAGNYFDTLATLAAGAASGLSPIVDLATIFPPTGPEADLCFICEGGLQGQLVVMGSQDGSNFCPVGSFRRDRVLEDSPDAVEFSVLSCPDKIRYARLSLAGQVTSPVIVTVGGNVPANEMGGTPSIQNLPDADTTVQPGVTLTTIYSIPAGSQTGSRSTILGIGGPPQDGQMVDVLRYDRSAYTRAIVDGGPLGNTLYTFPPSPTVPWTASFQYNGADWQFVGVRPLAAV